MPSSSRASITWYRSRSEAGGALRAPARSARRAPAPQLQRLGEVRSPDRLASLEVGKGARDPQHPMHAPGAEGSEAQAPLEETTLARPERAVALERRPLDPGVELPAT